MLLSSLGNILSARFGKPLRVLLGRRKLRSIIEAKLGRVTQFQGENTRLEIRLIPASEMEHPRRYDPIFWTAFSKPIQEQKVRWIDPVGSFNFVDLEISESTPPGYLNIGAELIPSTELSRPIRDAQIKNSIQHWCSAAGLDPASFGAREILRAERNNDRKIDNQNRGQVAASGPDPLNTNSLQIRVQALINFIDAVPEGEQSKFSLPLDLIRRFVS